jgi:predicted nucleic acid-binding protein
VSFLLDTNVVSEWTRPGPDPGVVAWLADADEDCLFLSVVTLAELRHGVERLPAGSRRRRLDAWLGEDLPLRFEGRILPLDATIVEGWGRLVARREAVGRPIGVMDAFIAATANAHSLTLVTRNVMDLAAVVPRIIDPWSG